MSGWCCIVIMMSTISTGIFSPAPQKTEVKETYGKISTSHGVRVAVMLETNLIESSIMNFGLRMDCDVSATTIACLMFRKDDHVLCMNKVPIVT